MERMIMVDSRVQLYSCKEPVISIFDRFSIQQCDTAVQLYNSASTEQQIYRTADLQFSTEKLPTFQTTCRGEGEQQNFLAVDRFADLSALDCNLPYCSQIPKSRSLENITLM